ncbi:MAG: hypothetical protein Q9170_003205 [Blastenia crenularia]
MTGGFSVSPTLRVKGQPVRYPTSDYLTRCFCGQCGAFVYNHDSDLNCDNIASGVVGKAQGIVEFKEHIFVDDTKDGGLSSWVSGTAWSGHTEQSEKMQPSSKPRRKNNAAGTADPNEVLKCHCQCRGVQFNITHPNEASSNVSSPAPDVLAPYHFQSSQNSPDSAWWLRANGTKYLAGTCACNSCRLSAGYDIQAWAFVPEANIQQLNGEKLDYGMGTLKRYSHSKRAYREFCGTCGATVFWHSDERPGVVDVSVGLLDAEEGAKADNWLEWTTDRVSFEECANNKSLISKLSKGLKDWAAE